MPGVLIAYATTHGHTAKIAGRMAEAIRGEGREVALSELTAGENPDPSAYDGAIAGASLHRSHHQREMVDWAKAHRDALGELPTLFFSVSLSAAEDTEEAREATQRCIDDFTDETGWTPARTVTVAGALQYLEYDAFTRTLVRLMMKSGGHPTDTSRDYDYTDWDAVERLGREFAAQLGS